MNNFTYYAPTKVFFGKGADDDVGAVLKEYGAKKLLVHYGGGSAKRSGLLDKVLDSLKKAGLAYVELGGVEPNPKVSLVREAVALCKKENVDMILAIGGGSVIDSSKSTALSVGSDADPWDLIMRKAEPKTALPIAVVLTLSAAGSEMSSSQVLTNPELKIKKGLGSNLVRPKFAFMNPENTYTVPAYHTACGAVDIMMHTFERYYTLDRDTELTDRLGESILISVKNAGAIAVREPENYEARATLMWASSLSHNDLTGCGKAYKTMTVHQLEHGVSGVFDHVAHGAGLAVLYPAWAEYVYKKDLRRFCQTAVRLWNIPMDFENPEKTAAAGVRAMKEYFRSIGMPVSLRELGIGPESFEEIADVITNNGTMEIYSTYVSLNKERILEILKIAE